MTEPVALKLSRVPDGGALRVLERGLTIVRRRKHEWVAGLKEMKRERLEHETGKVRGSKFLSTWSLQRLVDWIEGEMKSAGWRRQSGGFTPLNVVLEESVGLVNGNEVCTIRIVCADGQNVHAYPVKDSP